MDEKPFWVEDDVRVLVTPTQSKYVHYAHRIEARGQNTACGMRTSRGFVWEAKQAVIAQSHWCKECW